MFGFSETKQQMQDLLLEGRSYANLQKKALLAGTRDKLSVILSRLAIAVVCLVLGGMALLFFSFFLAYILGQVLDNTALGFACVTAFVLLLLLIFWHWRTKWVVIPITNMLFNLFVVDDETLETEKISDELKESRTRMSDNFNSLLSPMQEPANRVESLSNWLSRGFAAYEGLRLGISVIRAFTGIFGRKRRRK
jgi:Na+/proline symporter